MTESHEVEDRLEALQLPTPPEKALSAVIHRVSRARVRSRVMTAALGLVMTGVVVGVLVAVVPSNRHNARVGAGVTEQPTFLVGTVDTGESVGVYRLDAKVNAVASVATLPGSPQGAGLRWPDVALDGNSVFIVHTGEDAQDHLAKLTFSGELEFSQSVVHGPETQVPADYIVAGVGAVWLYHTDVTGPDEIREWLTIHDEDTGHVVGAPISLASCSRTASPGMFVNDEGDLVIVCDSAGDVRILAASGEVLKDIHFAPPADPLQVRDGASAQVMGTAFSPSDNELYLLTQNGRLYSVSTSQGLVASQQLALSSDVYVSYKGLELLSDGQTLLAAVGHGPVDPLHADTLVEVDRSTFQVGVVVPLEFQAGALVSDGADGAILWDSSTRRLVKVDLQGSAPAVFTGPSIGQLVAWT
jgi:hypothetical protein